MIEILSIIGTVYLIHTFAWFTPGPLFILVLKNSLSYGFRAGCLNGIGIALGNLVHMGYAIISLLFIAGLSDNILFYIKYIGAAYLGYLGIKILLSAHGAKRKVIIKEYNKKTPLLLIIQGFLVNITSPKASIFFVTIFTILISQISNLYIIILVVFLLSVNSLIMACVLSFLFSRERVIKIYDKNLAIINIILGIFMLIFASFVLIY